MKKEKSTHIASLGLFIAIEIVFCFTPLGSIPLGPGIVATLAHIPVIISALILNKKQSIFMGFIMGLCSFIWWSTTGLAYPVSFAFTPFSELGNFLSIIVCFVPRILLPLFTLMLYKICCKKFNIVVSAGISSGIATFLHSILVLTLVYMFFSKTIENSFLNFILAWSGVNALVEIAIAVLISIALIKPLKAIKSNN